MSQNVGVGDAAEETEAPDHEHNSRRDLERRASGSINGRSARLVPPPGDGTPGGVHRLHPGGNGDGHGDDGLHHPPVPADLRQVTAEFTVRQSPWLPPDELKAYYEVDPDFARGIIETIQSAQQARIDAELIPIRAEAWALKVATVGVTFLPWIAAGLAAVFALLGLDTAALISGIFSVATGGVQILHAVRRPQVVQAPRPQSSAPASKPKPSQASKPKHLTSSSKSKKRKKRSR